MNNLSTVNLPSELQDLKIPAKPVLGWYYTSKDDLALGKTSGNVATGDKLPQLQTKPHTSADPHDVLSIKSIIPSQLESYYGWNKVTNHGEGQTIYIIDAYGNPNYQADLDHFCTQFNLPKTTVDNYYYGGVPNWNSVTPSTSATWLGWAYETNLDLQYAHAMAPSAKKVLITCIDNTQLFNATYAVFTQLSATILSMSWGIDEASVAAQSGGAASILSADQTLFTGKNAIFCASSGDTGGVTSYPATSPDVVSVGGSQLNGGSASNYWVAPGPFTETTWSYAGSGPSVVFAKPNYQTNFQPTSARWTPDVSYNAGSPVPVYITQPTPNGIAGWGYFMGTSCSAPQIAALAARLISSGKLTTVNSKSLQTTLYGLASSNYNYFFNDIITGNNTVYASFSGYDAATGLGSPIINNISNYNNVIVTPTPTITVTPTKTSTVVSLTPTPTVTKTKSTLLTTPTATSAPQVTPTATSAPRVTPTPSSTINTNSLPPLSAFSFTPVPYSYYCIQNLKVSLSGTNIEAIGSTLIALSGSTVLGSAKITNAPNYTKAYQLLVFSPVATLSSINLAVFNSSNNTIYNINEKINLVDGVITGTVRSPITVNTK